jgi:hypothetical protein
MQIVNTDEWRLTAPLTNPMESNVNINAGFRPMESSKDPKVGEMNICVSAAHADKIDNVDVARSDPSSAMRAGAGENPTMVKERTMRKEDDWNKAKSLLLQGTNSPVDNDIGADSFKSLDFLAATTAATVPPPPLVVIARDCCSSHCDDGSCCCRFFLYVGTSCLLRRISHFVLLD